MRSSVPSTENLAIYETRWKNKRESGRSKMTLGAYTWNAG
jgi:hypothetical protein